MLGITQRKASEALRTGFVAMVVIAAAFSASAQAETQPRKVVELFTSQGCSSCPPADHLAARLAKENKDILTVVMPVDYWDYLGWKDTLASPEHSQRQRAYAARRGDRSVYTPQMIVNGEEHVVGSREQEVLSALSRTQPFTTSVELSISDMVVQAKVEGTLPEGAKMATVYFMRLQEAATVDIGRGENAGRKITYVNVVRTLQPMGVWSGETETFRMPKSKLMIDGESRCAILVQVEGQDGPGQIIGATVSGPHGNF
ncbi:DUF1223 domain-containing protein [Rhodobacterales bacterium]|nr:DUF1223 domain-containing protein [Rhodobacterales bacterium]